MTQKNTGFAFPSAQKCYVLTKTFTSFMKHLSSSFGAEGSQLVNVTYSGDTLIATKITGECHVPKGEVVFKADLFPLGDDDVKDNKLEPIPLNESAASKWNIKKLERYIGEGRITSDDAQNIESVDGQLIMFEGYFSFLFLPSKNHIFFSRPSPQLIVHLMKEVIYVEDELQNMKDHLQRCFLKDIDKEFVAPRRKIKDPYDAYSEILKQDVNNDEEEDISNKLNSWVPSSLKKDSAKFSFWSFHKWKRYIDSVLKPPNKNDGLV